MQSQITFPGARRTGLYVLALAACSWLLMASAPMQAQTVVQRNFLNPSFEVPLIVPSTNPTLGCHRTLPANWVPGWASTEEGSAPAGFNLGCPTGGTFVPPTNWDGMTPSQNNNTPPFPIPASSQTANTIQLFNEPVSSVNAADGDQWAELNADTPSRLYQQMCLANNEVIVWRLSHRARSNTVNPEVMEFNIGSSIDGVGSTLIVRGSSITSGAQGTPIPRAPARNCPTSVGGQSATCNVSVDSATGWVTYSGQFT